MPDVEGQWDFYPNLRLKIKHSLSACGTFYAKSHRCKKYATTTIMSQITNAKPNSAACTQWRRQGGGGGSRDMCPVPAVPRQLAGRWEAETAAAS